MFLSKKTVFLPFALSFLVVAPASAKKPDTFLGKIGTSVLQTMNEHSFFTSVCLNKLKSGCFKLDAPKNFKELINQCLVTISLLLAEKL